MYQTNNQYNNYIKSNYKIYQLFCVILQCFSDISEQNIADKINNKNSIRLND